MHNGKPREDIEGKRTIYKPKREASEEGNPADTSISDYRPPES